MGLEKSWHDLATKQQPQRYINAYTARLEWLNDNKEEKEQAIKQKQKLMKYSFLLTNIHMRADHFWYLYRK